MRPSQKKQIAPSLRLAIEAVQRCRELLINADADADDLAEYDAAAQGLKYTLEEWLALNAPRANAEGATP